MVAANGLAPYEFAWSTTPVQNTATATNLGAGDYTVTVTDAADCTAELTVVVGNLDGPTAETTDGTALCGTPEGEVSVSARADKNRTATFGAMTMRKPPPPLRAWNRELIPSP